MPNLNRRYATLAATLLTTAGIGGASTANVVTMPLRNGRSDAAAMA